MDTPKQEYVYIYALTQSNHIHVFVVKRKYYYTFFLGIRKIVEWMVVIDGYYNSVAVMFVNVQTRYLQLGMSKYSGLVSSTEYVHIFPIYMNVFGCSEVEKYCRTLETTLRMKRQYLGAVLNTKKGYLHVSITESRNTVLRRGIKPIQHTNVRPSRYAPLYKG